MRDKRPKRKLLVFVFSMVGMATLAAGECIENVDVYYPNGTAANCRLFCIVSGGYIAAGCNPI